MRKILILLLLASVPVFAVRKTTRADSISATGVRASYINAISKLTVNSKDVETAVDRAATWNTFREAVDSDHDNKVSGTGIENNAIGSNQMDDNSVGTAEIIDGDIGMDDLSTAVVNYIDAAGGGTITNNEDDTSIKENGSNELYVNNQYGAGVSVLGSDTPNISTALTYVANDPDTISNFTGNPGASVFKEILIRVNTSNFVVSDGSIDCGGVDLGPDSLDVLKVLWDGLEYHCSFEFLHN